MPASDEDPGRGLPVARLALILAYDGSAFDGWQTQPSGRGVQDHLERALAAIAGHPVATICAGRTDAGVHALRQVVHFDSEAQRPASAWIRGVNAHLPAQVAVREVRQVDEGFHARYGATHRRYRYLLHLSPVRHPLLAGRAGWTFRHVDPSRLREAATLLAGEHDFSAFRSSECQAASPVRRIDAIDVAEQGPLLLLTFVGNAFLHHMIRNIVGTLLMAADGRRPVDWVGEVLASRDRRFAAPTFSPDGLYLDGARYDPRFDLPSWGADDGASNLLAALR
ncbi:tRNA pseudouridine(38-40) synthase TruA [Burkholderiaceae bacterium FT117]|nr:tRNA pseudouridine(38-40) synthase TruA [Zeimonas sediminis]MCM5569547.1 tRNA pseudouridine(38-40) synthase TruA [Zeimonas sediminis]